MVAAFSYGAASCLLEHPDTPIADLISVANLLLIGMNKVTHYPARVATTKAVVRISDEITSALAPATHEATRDTATFTAIRAATENAVLSAIGTATDEDTGSSMYESTVRVIASVITDTPYVAVHNTTNEAVYAAATSAMYKATAALREANAAVSAGFACLQLAGLKGLKRASEFYWAYQGGNMQSPWVCFIEAARDVLGLQLPEYKNYQPWEDCAKHGSFRILHTDFCIVSDFPEQIHQDDQNRPHNENGPSHRWRDGWELYHWHGVKVPKEWIMDKSITAKDALTWPNIEQRRAACEIIGWGKVLDEL